MRFLKDNGLTIVLMERSSRPSAAANEEALQHGEEARTAFDHLLDAQLWFESLQNWQSEFLSTAVLVVLTILLRFRGSPVSKPVVAPHAKTGN